MGSISAVIVHPTIAKLKAHPAYAAAKAGDSLAALALAKAMVKPEKVPERFDYVVPVVQVDTSKFNAIPVAMARALARANGGRMWLETVQVNVVGHTGASGLHRLLHQPEFGGEPPPAGARVLICDDVVTYGSSLANLSSGASKQIPSRNRKIPNFSGYKAASFARNLGNFTKIIDSKQGDFASQ